jgi:alkanesulfonate monooxygenase SsuD/methylene tetrahydromethanopterin reductase-like flavin-dependent oxidoreductase (luciferase family)
MATMTSNRFRPPAMLARIAATVDVVSDGGVGFGIGVRSDPNPLAPGLPKGRQRTAQGSRLTTEATALDITCARATL